MRTGTTSHQTRNSLISPARLIKFRTGRGWVSWRTIREIHVDVRREDLAPKQPFRFPLTVLLSTLEFCLPKRTLAFYISKQNAPIAKILFLTFSEKVCKSGAVFAIIQEPSRKGQFGSKKDEGWKCIIPDYQIRLLFIDKNSLSKLPNALLKDASHCLNISTHSCNFLIFDSDSSRKNGLVTSFSGIFFHTNKP